ncbi:kremen protein 2 [Eleutherodactylus coqui]|uniref:kremen protein 2 n=1 Tax=Eleutherodactylus coqui TaxID=57060 RepID=UPI003462B484
MAPYLWDRSTYWKMLVLLLRFVLPVMSQPSMPEQSECFTVNGRDYRGSVNYAGAEKIPCLYWNQTIQHRYNTQSDLSGELGLGNHNYCRNPDSDVQPWCYVSETEEGIYWKYCDILSCHMPGYIGCFVDRGTPTAFNGASGTSKKLTIQTCIQFCRRKGHEYAGVEAGYACFCGSSSDVAVLQMVSSSQCDQICFGRTDELCGGDGKLSVYSVWVGTCHGNFSSISGVLYSPDFPDEYNADRSCLWDIILPGSMAIQIQFQSFHISDPNDVLELKDGETGSLLFQIRGGQEPPNIITFQTDHLQITFQSDREFSGPGYVILYTGLGNLGSSVVPFSETMPSNIVDEGPQAQSSHEHHASRNVWLLLAAGSSVLLLGIGYMMWRYLACDWCAPLLGTSPDHSYCCMLYRHKKVQSGDLTSVNQSSMKSLL